MKLRGYLFSIVAGFGLALVSGYDAKPMKFLCQNGSICEYKIVDVHSINKYDAKKLIDSGNIHSSTEAIISYLGDERFRVGSGYQTFEVYAAVWRNPTQ
jgi:hypothetical protein